MGYMLSLVLGGIGFISMGFITNQYLLFVSFILIGVFHHIENQELGYVCTIAEDNMDCK